MALAEYFSKDLLAINKLLNTSPELLSEKLEKVRLEVMFDTNAAETEEGRKGLDLLIRLLARLYPSIFIVDLSGKHKSIKENLQELAKNINRNIEIPEEAPEDSLRIVAGYTTDYLSQNRKEFFFGSNNWIADYSNSYVQRFHNSNNSFGVGFSACITAANVFKSIFIKELSSDCIDNEIHFSTYSLSLKDLDNPIMEGSELPEVFLVGLGAIGNGLCWGLGNASFLKGTIHLIDDEKLETSNLQRYILSQEDDVDKYKTDYLKDIFEYTFIKAKAHSMDWSSFISARANWNIDCVLVGIDNLEDRIGIQSSLPKSIINAFTEDSTLGITRHYDFNDKACLACSNFPLKPKKSYLEEIAIGCGIEEYINLIRHYYNAEKPIDQQLGANPQSLLEIIAKKHNLPLSKLETYKGKRIEVVYSELVCGGQLLQMTNDTTGNQEIIDAPLSFQSVMAGLLAGVELIRYTIGQPFSAQRTDLYVLSSLNENNPYHREIEKDQTGRCLCRDGYIISRFKEKYYQ